MISHYDPLVRLKPDYSMFAWLANREIIALNASHDWGKVEKGLATLSGNQKNGPAWAGKLRAGAGEIMNGLAPTTTAATVTKATNRQYSRPGRKQGQKIPHQFVAIPVSLFATMHERSSTENEVLLAIMRYTLGYGFEWVTLSAKRIGEIIGKGEKTADRALASLRSKGLLAQKIGKRNKRLRSWRVAWESFEPTPAADPDFAGSGTRFS